MTQSSMRAGRKSIVPKQFLDEMLKRLRNALGDGRLTARDTFQTGHAFTLETVTLTNGETRQIRRALGPDDGRDAESRARYHLEAAPMFDELTAVDDDPPPLSDDALVVGAELGDLDVGPATAAWTGPYWRLTYRRTSRHLPRPFEPWSTETHYGTTYKIGLVLWVGRCRAAGERAVAPVLASFHPDGVNLSTLTDEERHDALAAVLDGVEADRSAWETMLGTAYEGDEGAEERAAEWARTWTETADAMPEVMALEDAARALLREQKIAALAETIRREEAGEDDDDEAPPPVADNVFALREGRWSVRFQGKDVAPLLPRVRSGIPQDTGERLIRAALAKPSTPVPVGEARGDGIVPDRRATQRAIEQARNKFRKVGGGLWEHLALVAVVGNGRHVLYAPDKGLATLLWDVGDGL